MSSSSRKTRDDDGINGTVLKVVLVHDNVVFGGGRSRYGGARVVSLEARKTTREENERVVVVSDL